MVDPVALCPSMELAPGAIRAAELDGAEVVVWRDHDGGVHVHDARCPHAWNHLAAIGAVDGPDLVCTAHLWRFDAAGCGTRRLSDGTREPMRDLRTYPCAEQDGWIWATPG